MDIEGLCPLSTGVFRVLELDLLVFIRQLPTMRTEILATSDRCASSGISRARCCSPRDVCCQIEITSAPATAFVMFIRTTLKISFIVLDAQIFGYCNSCRNRTMIRLCSTPRKQDAQVC